MIYRHSRNRDLFDFRARSITKDKNFFHFRVGLICGSGVAVGLDSRLLDERPDDEGEAEDIYIYIYIYIYIKVTTRFHSHIAFY